MAHDVFISYASSDKAVADAVCSQLESIHRIRCWIAPRDVVPGASWAESIIDALDESKIMVLIFSSNANASMQIEREVERAVHKGINIIPLRIENTVPTKTLEYFISSPHWLDALTVPLEQHINTLAVSVKALLAKQGVSLPTVPPPAAAPMPLPMPAPPPVPVVKPAAAPSATRYALPALIILLVLGGVVAVRYRSLLNPPPESSATDTSTNSSTASPPAPAPAAGPAPPTEAAASTSPAAAPAPIPPSASSSPSSASPAASSGAAGASSSPAATEPGRAGAGSAPAASGAAPTAAAGASRSAGARSGAPVIAAAPNLLLEFDGNLSPGSLVIEVDGQVKMTHKLEDKASKASLVLPIGVHAVNVKLLDSKLITRDTVSRSISADPGLVRTLKIRLSRFRRNLEIEATTRPAAAAPASPATKP